MRVLAFGSVACLAGLALLPVPARADGSLRCDGGIVSVGDSKLDLVGKCGWPSLAEPRDARATFVREGSGTLSFERRVLATDERWTYDFGPNRFVQVVVLEMGKVVRIEGGSSGYTNVAATAEQRPPIPRARCDHGGFHVGDGTYAVLARCGEPAFREGRVDVLRTVVGDGQGQTIGESLSVTVEVWTYDFGPQVLVRHLTFEDGKLARIETGSPGYAR